MPDRRRRATHVLVRAAAFLVLAITNIEGLEGPICGGLPGLRLDTSYEVEPPSSRKCTTLSWLVPAPSSRRRRVDVRVWCRRSASREAESARPLPASFSPALIPRLPTNDSEFLFVRPDQCALRASALGVEMTSRTTSESLGACRSRLDNRPSRPRPIGHRARFQGSSAIRPKHRCPVRPSKWSIRRHRCGDRDVSNAEGLYRVPALVPGHYRVEIALKDPISRSAARSRSR